MNLVSTYVHLQADRRAALQPVTETFWPTIESRRDLDPGQLVMRFDFTGDWPTWEVHPAGDEIVTLLSGEAEMILRTAKGDERVTLKTPGDFVVVPKGVWHTGKHRVPTSMLFITPGEGTENRPTPP
jgi:mannose-6-phosphate isomerase-like protein (cupin superfamily)